MMDVVIVILMSFVTESFKERSYDQVTIQGLVAKDKAQNNIDTKS